MYFAAWQGEIYHDSGGGIVANSYGKWPRDLGGRRVGAIAGWGGLIIYQAGVPLVSLLRTYFEALLGYLCGRCVPCKSGNQNIARILARLEAGRGRPADLEQLERLGSMVTEGSMCELGRRAATPLLLALQHLRPEMERAIQGEFTFGGFEYRSLVTAPCIQGCPLRMDIPGYIGLLREGRPADAARIVAAATPWGAVLGRVCRAPCEEHCRRATGGEAVAIRLLKRAAVELGPAVPRAGSAPALPGGGTRVAVVGAGPAGLTAAYELARLGYRVTVYEASSKLGGLLATVIPSYRLPREVLRQQLADLYHAPFAVHLNVRVGKDISWEQVKQENAAVVLACGLTRPRPLGVPGEEAGYQGVYQALEFLRRVGGGEEIVIGERVAVIGGGDAAVDCARVARRLGAGQVTVYYRRSESVMPAAREEVEEAREEGVEFRFCVAPVALVGEAGKVTGVHWQWVREAARREPLFQPSGGDFSTPVDTVIIAVGQEAGEELLDLGLSLPQGGPLPEDASVAAGKAGIFLAGDLAGDGGTVVHAVASGKMAALQVDAYVRRRKTEEDEARKFLTALAASGDDDVVLITPEQRNRRLQEAKLPGAERAGRWEEVRHGLTPAQVRAEADRCLRCYRLVVVAVEAGPR